MFEMMLRKTLRTLAVALVAVLPSPVWAESGGPTVVTVKEMCGGCVKQINKRLDGFPGIATVACDLKTKSVTVTPKANAAVSARALWDAMDEIGKTPVKMVTPQGTFTSKP